MKPLSWMGEELPWLGTLLFLLLLMGMPANPASAGFEEVPLDRHSPFEELETRNLSLVEQWLWYEDFVCRYSDCSFKMGTSFPACSVCFNDVQCPQYGDCCPRTLFKEGNSSTDQLSPPPCLTPRGSLGSYFMVTSCPPSYGVTSIVSKCTDRDASDWRRILPVSSNEDGVTYVNKYCALCHDVTNYALWEMVLDCSGYGHDESVLSAVTSVDDLYSTIVRTGACDLSIQFPLSHRPRTCSPRSSEVISACNVTGEWRVYDERVVSACAGFPLAPYGEYRNVFCYLCNRDMEWRQPECQSGSPPWQLALTSILDLHDEEPVPGPRLGGSPTGSGRPDCQDNQFLDPASGKCRPMLCHQGKYLRNGTCPSIIAVTSSMGYVITLDVTLRAEADDVRNFVGLMNDVGEELVQPLDTEWDYAVQSFSATVKNVSCSRTVLLEMSVAIGIVPARELRIDDMEIGLLASYSDIAANGTDGSYSLSARLPDVAIVTTVQSSTRPGMPVVSPSNQSLVCSNGNSTISVRPSWSLFYDTSYNGIPMNPTRNMVALTRFLQCPQVELSSGQHAPCPNCSGELVVSTPNATVRVKRFTLLDGKARMCLEDYLALFDAGKCATRAWCEPNSTAGTGPERPSPDRQGALDPAGVLSFVCSVVSLLFLAATIVVFALFKKLRTPTGVCTMCMVGVLFLAQAVFQFGAEQTEVAGLCVALGVLAHYLWLSATFWMNACTFLMFYRLMFPLVARVHLGSRSRVLALASLYAFLSPAAVVASSLGANWGLHGDLGYGGAACYIKRATTRQLGMALPLGILVLTNLALFLCTVVHLKRGANSISSSKESRIGLYACAKLSVITGFSWAFLFVHEAVRNRALQYAVIVLFGLYGVVVFWALVLNQHVLGLCRACLSGEKDQITGTSTSSTVVRSRKDRETIVTAT